MILIHEISGGRQFWRDRDQRIKDVAETPAQGKGCRAVINDFYLISGSNQRFSEL